MSMARQLPLPFLPACDYAAVDFIPAPSNAAAREWLARPADWPFGRLVLCGPAGCGKTHLLHIWRNELGGTLLDGASLRALDDFPDAGPLAVDDADLADERALFHLINIAMQQGRWLLLAGREPPARWDTRLPDLASRLRASAVARIGLAEDALLRAVLARLLAARQLAVPQWLQEWLLTRLPRQPAALAEAVARLDHAALAHGQSITRALAAAVWAELAPEEENSPQASQADRALL